MRMLLLLPALHSTRHFSFKKIKFHPSTRHQWHIYICMYTLYTIYIYILYKSFSTSRVAVWIFLGKCLSRETWLSSSTCRYTWVFLFYISILFQSLWNMRKCQGNTILNNKRGKPSRDIGQSMDLICFKVRYAQNIIENLLKVGSTI